MNSLGLDSAHVLLQEARPLQGRGPCCVVLPCHVMSCLLIVCTLVLQTSTVALHLTRFLCSPTAHPGKFPTCREQRCGAAQRVPQISLTKAVTVSVVESRPRGARGLQTVRYDRGSRYGTVITASALLIGLTVPSCCFIAPTVMNRVSCTVLVGFALPSLPFSASGNMTPKVCRRRKQEHEPEP
jgi:hypothetical protein